MIALEQSPPSGRGIDSRRPLRYVRDTLHGLDEGRFLGEPVALGLRLLAVGCCVVAALVLAGDLPITPRVPDAGPAAVVVQCVVMAVTWAVVALVLLHRARTVHARLHAPFVVIPTIANVLRAGGEAYAVVYLGVGVAGASWTWITGAHPLFLVATAAGGTVDEALPLLSMIPGAPSSAARGALHLAACLLLAYGAIVLAYLAAESLIVAVFIASHVRRLLGGAAGPVALSAVAVPAPVSGAAATRRSFCTRCGGDLGADGSACVTCDRATAEEV